jgi:hypothetical protein
MDVPFQEDYASYDDWTVCEKFGHAYVICECDMQHACPMLICRDCDAEYEVIDEDEDL